jgi:hypothetical protein
MLKKILLGLLLIFLISQFFPANLPEVIKDNPADLLTNNDVPNEIEKMLRTSCYDCHSNETIYPWYSYVSPIKFLVSKDTRDGRKHLNFSDWETYEKGDKLEALDEIGEEVTEGEMPMKIYPITHPDAKLSDADRKAIATWAEDLADSFFE